MSRFEKKAKAVARGATVKESTIPSKKELWANTEPTPEQIAAAKAELEKKKS